MSFQLQPTKLLVNKNNNKNDDDIDDDDDSNNAEEEKEDEIAKLEAKLARLKLEKKQHQQQLLQPSTMESQPKWDRAAQMEMIFSEQDLLSSGIVTNEKSSSSSSSSSSSTINNNNDDDNNNNNNNILLVGTKNIVQVILTLVVLLWISQLPIGQDELARYSPTTGPKNAATATSVDLGDLNPFQSPTPSQPPVKSY